MSIKVQGIEVISDDLYGQFRTVSPGVFATGNYPSNPVEGDIIYDSDEKSLFVYDGTEWIIAGGGGQLNNLNPALPPFVSRSGPETVATNTDGKVEFSLDGENWSSTITIPPETIYYCDWTNDILSAAHDSQYATFLDVDYPNVGVSQEIELELKIDKLPDPFQFDTLTETTGDLEYISNTISPLSSINAPTWIWGSSTAINARVAIADGDWETIPSSPGSKYVNHGERIRVKHDTGVEALTDYATTLNIGYGTGAGEFETSTFSTTTQNQVIEAPVITSPSNGDIVDINRITITATPYTAVNSGSHQSTDWYIARDSAFTDIVTQSIGDTTNLESWSPNLASTTEESWFIKCRYNGSINNIQSPDSNVVNVTANVFYQWRMEVNLRGAGGDGAGDNGGSGSFRIDSVAYNASSPAGFAPFLPNIDFQYEPGGYASGGGSQRRGGNSTGIRLDGTAIAVCGGGGASGQGNRNMKGGGGGRGGHIGEAGVNGAAAYMERDGRSKSFPGGNGGSAGSVRGNGGGSNSATGINMNNYSTLYSGGGGAGGNGGGGGSAGQGLPNSDFGDTGAFKDDVDALVAGGGGGGGYYYGNASVKGVTLSNSATTTSGPSGAHVTYRITKSTDGSNFTEHLSTQTQTSSGSVNLKTLTDT